MPHETNRLIFQKSPCLLMQPCLTEKLGKSPAVFLQQLHYWLTSQKEVGLISENKRWIYNTSSDWAAQICTSARQVRRIIKKLEELGLILINKLSKKKTDRTNWYTINYEAVRKLFPSLPWTEQKPANSRLKLQPEDSSLKDQMSSSLGHNVLMYIETETTSEIKTKQLDAKEPTKTEDQQVTSFCFKNDLAKKLLDIWNHEVGCKTTEASMTKQRARYLVAAFKFKFNSCLEQWTAYCQAIASSQFLIKEYHQKYKLSLEWALKFDNLQRLKEGHFGVSTAFFNKTQETTVTKESLINDSLHLPEKEAFSRLIDSLGVGVYKSWFYDTKPQIKRTGEGTLAFYFNNKFIVDYISNHFREMMEKVLGTKVTVSHVDSPMASLAY